MERAQGTGEEGGGARAEESPGGGTDLCSSTTSPESPSPDHLVVMVHGILGSTADWQYAANEFIKQLPDKVVVHCSERNMFKLTLDGIDVMGERLAEEVLDVICRKPEIKKISFVAHSVGGLVARFAIGRLYRHPKRKSTEKHVDDMVNDKSGDCICGLEAMNFITVATPHLGSRGNKQVPFLFGFATMEKVACRVIHWIFGRTGKHLFLTDDEEGEPPLLQRMVDDNDDLYFISALRAFKRRVVYANVGYDHIVGWRTSSIRRNTELPKWEDSLNEKYPHIVYEEHSKESNEEASEELVANSESDILEGELDILEEKMVTGLRRVSWERVDVSFHTSFQRFAAHNVIQVKYSFMDTGADVIQHIIDHLLI